MSNIITKKRFYLIIFSRIFYYLITIISTYLNEQYDTSNQLYKNLDNNTISYYILRNINHLSNWDGVYLYIILFRRYLSITKYGYLFEQQHAFLPLFPLLIRYLSNILNFIFYELDKDVIYHISGLIIVYIK